MSRTPSAQIKATGYNAVKWPPLAFQPRKKPPPFGELLFHADWTLFFPFFVPFFVPTERSLDTANEEREMETSNAAIAAYESIGTLFRHTFWISMYSRYFPDMIM